MKNSLAKYMMRIALALAALCLATTALLAQAHFQSQTSGAWSSAGTWTIIAGSDLDGIPDANDTVEVVSGTSITAGGANVNCGILLVNAGGTLLIDGAGNVRVNNNPGSATIYGTVTISSTGTLTETGIGTRSLALKNGGRITISGTAANPSFDTYTYESNSTFEYTASGAQSVLSGVVYGNLTVGGSGIKTVAPIPSDSNFTMAGKLTVGSGVTFDASTNLLRIYFNGNVENSGTIDASVGVTVVWVRGTSWINNGSYLPSRTPGFSQIPTTTFSNCVLSGTPVAQTLYNVAIEGTSSTLMNLTVDSNFTIAAGAIFSAGTGLSHQVKGNWTNSGTFNAGTSTITFNGTTNQSIGASTFNNLVINNPAGVTLAGNISSGSAGTVTVTSGTVNTGPSTLSVTSTAPAALVLGSNMIIGTVSRAIASGSTSQYLFSGTNAYVVPGGTNNPSTMTLAPHPATNPPNLGPAADTTLMAKRYYTLTASGAGSGFTYTLRLPYEQSEARGDESRYMLWQYAGSYWSNLGSSPAADTVNNYVGQSGISGAGDFAIAEDIAALPVELVSFTGEQAASSSDVRLKWTTATETNNFGFYVQRSPSSEGEFTDLPANFVPGGGTSLVPRNYGWTDQHPLTGTGYYRLKQVDLDGTVQYCKPIQVDSKSSPNHDKSAMPEQFSLGQNYPNPFNPTTAIRYTVAAIGSRESETIQVRLAVYDLLGKEVALLVNEPQTPGNYEIRFDGKRLASGMYLYTLTAGKYVETRKLVLMR
jgi:hypothetical protein